MLAVLQGQSDAPGDLRERALQLAAGIIEFSPKVERGNGYTIAKEILSSGKAWQKFQAICAVQGGMREPERRTSTRCLRRKIRSSCFH